MKVLRYALEDNIHILQATVSSRAAVDEILAKMSEIHRDFIAQEGDQSVLILVDLTISGQMPIIYGQKQMREWIRHHRPFTVRPTYIALVQQKSVLLSTVQVIARALQVKAPVALFHEDEMQTAREWLLSHQGEPEFS